MNLTATLKSAMRRTLFYLIIEVAIYAALVSLYVGLVLSFLVDWLKDLFAKEPALYAMVAILLMIVQAVALERVVTSLVYLARRGRK
ncbi:MAG: hypothetical protein JO151_18120 [Verrucomicrobia bacterium]|nr:hypothetical protein [Verrucomicrobiota bacterium]